MKKRKKYATGTKIKGYMEDPFSELAQNQMFLADAKQQAASDPFTNILSALGNGAMQYGLSKGGFGDSKAGKVGNSILPMLANLQFGMGGKVPNIPVEVEGKEVAETPTGELINFEGPLHENGGIDINLPEGTEIFSKRIKVKGKTMAQRKLDREKKVMTLEKLLEKSKGDKILKQSLKRTKDNNKLEEDKDQKLQEMIAGMTEAAKFAYGTGNKGVKKYMGGTGKDGVLPGENKFPDFTAGDITGLLGTLYSTFAPGNNTQANRAGDTPNINAFKDFGIDGLAKLEEAESYIEGQKDNALQDLTLKTNSSIKRNRNGARGINSKRALDIATESQTNEAQGDIFDAFSKQMMNLLSQQAGFENQQDQVVMAGEQAKDLADRQDRDNYFSQMAQDIASKGEGIQTFGKMLNENKANTMAEKAINDSSVNFKYTNGVLTDKAGNTVMSASEIEKSAKALNMTVEEYIKMINK